VRKLVRSRMNRKRGALMSRMPVGRRLGCRFSDRPGVPGADSRASRRGGCEAARLTP
jgi:hypothetical protein